MFSLLPKALRGRELWDPWRHCCPGDQLIGKDQCKEFESQTVSLVDEISFVKEFTSI